MTQIIVTCFGVGYLNFSVFLSYALRSARRDHNMGYSYGIALVRAIVSTVAMFGVVLVYNLTFPLAGLPFTEVLIVGLLFLFIGSLFGLFIAVLVDMILRRDLLQTR